MSEHASGRWSCALAGMLAVLHVTSITVATANVAACGGRDMMAEMQAADPAAHARVRMAAAATANARAVLWRIEDGAAAPSHLFGTVHLTDDRVNALSANVRAALAGAKRVALEIADLSPQGMAAAVAGLRELVMFSKGRRLDDLLGGEELEIARSALQSTGIPRQMTGSFRPWLVTLSLAVTPCERNRAASGLAPLDMRLADTAKRRGIPVVGLETLEDQLRAMASVPEADQLQVLRVSLKYHDRSADLMETMIQRYLERDIGSMWPFQIELARQAGLAPETFTTFEHQMIGVRNARMRDAAVPLLREGGAFIGVGALHLPGRLGLVEMLREAGYTLTAVE